MLIKKHKRADVSGISMHAEPSTQWRHVSVREKKTKVDRVIEMVTLLKGRYSDSEKMFIVSDHRNTHTLGAFYETFEPSSVIGQPNRIPRHTQERKLADQCRK